MIINVFNLREKHEAFSGLYNPDRIRPLRLKLLEGDWVKNCSIQVLDENRSAITPRLGKRDLQFTLLWRKL